MNSQKEKLQLEYANKQELNDTYKKSGEKIIGKRSYVVHNYERIFLGSDSIQP